MIIRSKSLISIMGIVISGLVLSSEPSFCKGPWGKNKNQMGVEGQGKRLLEPESSDFDSDKGKQRSGVHGAVGADAARIKALFDQAEALTREGSTKAELDTAISKLQEALRIAQKKDIARAAARAYVQLGLIHLWRSELDKSLEYNEKAIKEAKRGGNCKALSVATKNIGNVHKARGQYDQALKDISQAVRIAEDCGDKTGVAWALWNWGEVCKFQGRYDEALRHLQRGLQAASEIKNPEIEAYIRQETGVVYTLVGQYSQAADYLQKALSIGEQIRKPRIEQESLGGLGDLYFAQGKYRIASDYYQKTLDRARLYGDKRRETQALISQGKVYAEWGRYRDALARFEEGLALSKTTGIALHQPRILVDMGAIFSSRGQYQKATSLFEQALEQFRKMGITKGEAHVLENLGLIYQTSGEYDKALNYFQQGLEICKKTGLPTRAACRNIGNLYLDMGEVDKAESFIMESGYPGSLGRLYLVKADYLSAKKYYERLFQSAELNRSARNLFTSCTGLGLAYEGMGDDSKAAEYYRKAVEHTEAIRSGLSPAERETFFDVRIEGFYRTTPYEGLARILVKMKKPLEAFKESEYTRARIFAEAISRRAEYGGYDIPPDVRDQDASLTDELASLTKNLQNAYENENKDQIASLEPQVKEVKEKFAAHVDMLRDQYPLFAATHYPQPMDLNKTALRDDEWTLAYHVTDPGILIYVAKGKNLVSCHFKPITRKEIDGLVRRFREPVEITPGDDIKSKLRTFDFAAGKRLYDLILADAFSTIPASRPVVVIPDDSLGVIPFEMLPMNSGGKVAADKEIPLHGRGRIRGRPKPRFILSIRYSVNACSDPWKK